MIRLKLRLLLAIWLPLYAAAQQVEHLTIAMANEWAAQHYPLLVKKQLAQETALAAKHNLSSNFLPQLNLNSQASWQSDVTYIPIMGSTPGFPKIEPISQDQYRAILDVNQLLYDGGINRQQKTLNEIQALLTETEVNVGLQQLKERINNLYLNILLLDEQRKQTSVLMADIDAGINKINAQLANGTAFRSNLAVLQAEKIKTKQRDTELLDERHGLIQVLALYTNHAIDANAQLQPPATPMLQENEIVRPELQLFQLQDSLQQKQALLVNGRLKPRISLFANGGYGLPGLNMLKNEFAPFVTTGIRLNWNISGWYTSKREKEITEINRREIQSQEAHFLLNTRSKLQQQKAQITKLQHLLQSDDEIIALKTQVKEAAKAQLENGILTASDYLREVTAEDQARLTKTIHQLQLLQAAIQYATIAGK